MWSVGCSKMRKGELWLWLCLYMDVCNLLPQY
jgi:hypothetical protein